MIQRSRFLAANFPDARITATDISDDALALARENAERLGLTNRIEWLTGDLLLYVNHVYDLIVANLPYVGVVDRAALSREVLHDPEVALFGGEHGDEMVRKLIEAAPAKLRFRDDPGEFGRRDFTAECGLLS